MEITVRQMYLIENKGHDMGFLKTFMMENAGAAATRRLVAGFAKRHGSDNSDRIFNNDDIIRALDGVEIAVLAGLGNNGGDGMVMARHLAGYGARVVVHLLGEPDKIKTEESRWNWSLLAKMPSVMQQHYASEFTPPDAEPKIVIDAIFGTGITGDIRAPYISAINYINSQKNKAFCFGVDVPSGLDPQTGKVANAHTTCDMTVTFHKMKQGIPQRPDLTGATYVEKIGIPPEAEGGIL